MGCRTLPASTLAIVVAAKWRRASTLFKFQNTFLEEKIEKKRPGSRFNYLFLRFSRKIIVQKIIVEDKNTGEGANRGRRAKRIRLAILIYTLPLQI